MLELEIHEVKKPRITQVITLNFIESKKISELVYNSNKVRVPVSVRVLKSTPMVRSTYVGVFTVHNAASIFLAASGRF